MKVAIYTRVSTSAQNTRRQIRDLREYAESQGWTVVEEIEEVVSGKQVRREGFVFLYF